MTVFRLVSAGRPVSEIAFKKAVEAVRDRERSAHVLFDDHDSDPSLLDRQQRLVKLVDDDRSQTEADFVA
jgi:hypothetical protein